MKQSGLKSDKGFPETEWRLVQTASQAQMPHRTLALEALLQKYLPVLRLHLLLRYHVTKDQADDWLQSFVLKRILEKNILAVADNQRGNLRTFLLQSLHNFVLQQLRHEQARKRVAPGGTVLLDDLCEAELAQVGPDARMQLDTAWARGILGDTLQRMERECLKCGRTDVLGIFECRILKPLLEEADPLPYEQVVKRFNLASPAQASNLLITAKRMFGRTLRSVIGEYAHDEAEVEEEIQELKAILFHA